MPMSEKQMRVLEEGIPELGRKAVASAYAQALSSGHPVTVSLEGHVVEIHPDGTRKVLKKLPPKVAVERGRRLKIQ